MLTAREHRGGGRGGVVFLAARLILLLRAFEERRGKDSLSGGLGAGVLWQVYGRHRSIGSNGWVGDSQRGVSGCWRAMACQRVALRLVRLY